MGTLASPDLTCPRLGRGGSGCHHHRPQYGLHRLHHGRHPAEEAVPAGHVPSGGSQARLVCGSLVGRLISARLGDVNSGAG